MFSKTRSHDVKYDGRTLKPVDVFNPLSQDDLIEMVDDGIESWTSICAQYHKAKAVEMQAARRREQTAKGIPILVATDIYDNVLTVEEKTKFATTPNGLMLQTNRIADIYREQLMEQAEEDAD